MGYFKFWDTSKFRVSSRNSHPENACIYCNFYFFITQIGKLSVSKDCMCFIIILLYS